MDSFGDLLLALIVALGLVYFVLASQFESFLMVEISIPEIMVMLMSDIISAAPSDIPRAMGTRARIVVRVVMSTGRTRSGQV